MPGGTRNPEHARTTLDGVTATVGVGAATYCTIYGAVGQMPCLFDLCVEHVSISFLGEGKTKCNLEIFFP